MTLIYIAKLVFYSHLHKIKQANEKKVVESGIFFSHIKTYLAEAVDCLLLA